MGSHGMISKIYAFIFEIFWEDFRIVHMMEFISSRVE